MLWKLVAVVAFSLGIASPAIAVTPPWCGSPNLNDSERMVCIDDILSRLDLELNEVFALARRVRGDLDQSAWLAERNACGARVLCLENAYRSRIAELREVVARSGARPGESERQAGRAAPVDEALGSLVAHTALFVLDAMTPRPWCSAGRLSPTERTICGDPNLARLDALLELSYGRTTARDGDRVQLRWLREERNACGADRLCIARAYSARIDLLSQADAAAGPDAAFGLDIPPAYRPSPGMCRVWYIGRPPEQQPPPSSCNVRVPAGAVLVRG